MRITTDRTVSRKLYPSKRKSDQYIRKEVFERDKFTCQMCGIKPKDIPVDYDGKYTLYVHPKHLTFSYLVVDHIIPWKKGGTIESHNLQVLCDPCNCLKGDKVNGV
jgi:5-methylcytosine-specific restriction endonuclease McrA